jgi:NTE family protein
MATTEQTRSLDGLELFAHLSEAERAELASRFEQRALQRGDVLMREGAPANALYVVVSGRFDVTVAGRSTPLSEIGPGQPVGEIAFLAGGTRTATVTAMRDSLVLRLDRNAFDRLVALNPDIWRAMTLTLAGRLGAVTMSSGRIPPEPRVRTIAVIRAGSAPVPEAFVARLHRQLSQSSRTISVDAAAFAAELSPGMKIGDAAATEALNTIESTHETVLLITDDELTPFSEKAIRHADLAIAVGVEGSDPGLSPHEVMAARYLPATHRRLVLIHPNRERPSGTARWLSKRQLAMHHHVALTDDTDIARLVRFIDGRATGLVACGGGALCNAHVGIYQAFTEAGITFDIMGGTSAGSAMTGAFALGWSADDVDQAVHEIFVANAAMRRYTLPRYSLLDHTHFDRQLARHFGGVDIEDLWVPFFAVSSNLSSCRLHTHRSGDLWEAIRASASIPVFLPPVYTDDGQMLVDGAILDNVPVTTMHALKRGPNAVISFQMTVQERYRVNYRALPSRARLLMDSLLPWRRSGLPTAPGLGHVLLRSLMVNRQEFLRHLNGDDVVLVPPVPASVGFLDWHRHSEVKKRAHAWATEEVERLVAAHHPLVAGVCVS